MADLRRILRRHVEQEVLREIFGERSLTAEHEEINRIRQQPRFVEQVDREVERIVMVFLDELEKNSPKKRSNRFKQGVFAFISILCAPGIGYAVNIENWVFVSLLSVILLSAQLYMVFLAD